MVIEKKKQTAEHMQGVILQGKVKMRSWSLGDKQGWIQYVFQFRVKSCGVRSFDFG
jgi:hypothetical protein